MIIKSLQLIYDFLIVFIRNTLFVVVADKESELLFGLLLAAHLSFMFMCLLFPTSCQLFHDLRLIAHYHDYQRCSAVLISELLPGLKIYGFNWLYHLMDMKTISNCLLVTIILDRY